MYNPLQLYSVLPIGPVGHYQTFDYPKGDKQ